MQGQTDVDLDDVGVIQAAQAAPGVARHQPDVIISSDLRRAVRTAQALAAVIGLPIELDARLRERSFGPWEGLTRAQLREKYPDDHERWGTGARIENPAIETVDDLAQRVGAALRDAALRVGDGTAVLVTHGAAARAGCAGLLGWPTEVWPTLGVLGNCRYAELRHSSDRGWQLRAHNVG